MEILFIPLSGLIRLMIKWVLLLKLQKWFSQWEQWDIFSFVVCMSWIPMLKMDKKKKTTWTYDGVFLCQIHSVSVCISFRKFFFFFEYGPEWFHKGQNSLYGHFSRKSVCTHQPQVHFLKATMVTMEEVLVKPTGSAHPVVCVGPYAVFRMRR